MVGHPRGTTPRTLRVASSGQVLVGTSGEPTRKQKYLDLSLGGMFIESLFPEDEGTKLKLDLQIEGFRLRLPAEVVWCRPVSTTASEPAGMGVAFEATSPAQKKVIYSELKTGVQRGQPTKAGTPPADKEGPDTKKGLRGLLSRLRGRT